MQKTNILHKAASWTQSFTPTTYRAHTDWFALHKNFSNAYCQACNCKIISKLYEVSQQFVSFRFFLLFLPGNLSLSIERVVAFATCSVNILCVVVFVVALLAFVACTTNLNHYLCHMPQTHNKHIAYTHVCGRKNVAACFCICHMPHFACHTHQKLLIWWHKVLQFFLEGIKLL